MSTPEVDDRLGDDTLTRLIRGEPRGSGRWRELMLFQAAGFAAQQYFLAVPDVADWVKAPAVSPMPDVLAVYSAYMRALDLVDRSPEDSVDLGPHRDELERLGIMQSKELRRRLVQFNGFMQAAEEMDPHRYARTLNDQIDRTASSWEQLVRRPYEYDAFFETPELVDDVYGPREVLEYGLSAIAQFQMETDDRLSGVHAADELRRLRQLEPEFRMLLKHGLRDRWHVDDELAPPSFWWRHLRRSRD